MKDLLEFVSILLDVCVDRNQWLTELLPCNYDFFCRKDYQETAEDGDKRNPHVHTLKQKKFLKIL